MAICQFFLRGQCRFGSNCRNEHPGGVTEGPGTFGNQTWTASKSGNSSTPFKGTFSVDSIKKDLTPGDDKPLWPLSSYGPGKSEATLINGVDESPEELRFSAWQAQRSGDPTQIEAYKSYEQNKIAAALSAHKNGQDNVQEAFRVAYRNAVPPSASQATTTAVTSQPSTFGQPSSFGQPAATSVFGQPSLPVSAFGQAPKPTSTFGQSAFNQTAQPTTTFGQPAFSQTTQPTSSAFGSAFGQPNKTPTAFGQPTFGQSSQPTPVFGQSAFGQASRPPAFGQPSFGQPSQPASAFGQQTQQTSAFGQPIKPAATFGQPAQPAQSSQPSAFGSADGGANAFGSSAGTTNGPFSGGFSAFASGSNRTVFGAPAAQSTFGTGGASTFGAGVGGSASAFGADGTGLATSSTDAASHTAAFGSNPSATLPAASSNPVASQQQPTAPNFAPPQSPFDPTADPYASRLPSNYVDLLPEDVRHAFQNKEFQWGQVPEWVPPMEMR